MRFRQYIPILGLSLLVSMSAYAQGEWLWNPGIYFQSHASSEPLLWGHFDYQVGSTSLNNALLNDVVFRSEITSEAADQNTGRFRGDQGRVGGYAEGELWVRLRAGNWNWMVGTGFRESFGARLQNDLLRLYLKGNAPYASETLTLGASRFYYASHQFIGLGLERSGAKVSAGFTANPQKVSRYQQLQMQGSEFYTAPYGEYVTSQLELTYESSGSSEPKLGAWYGTGITMSSYLHWQATKKTAFFAKVKDAGVLMFQGLNTTELDTNYLFQGTEIANILQLDDSLFEDGQLDSLEALLGLSISNETTSRLAPGYLMLGFSTSFSDRLGLSLELRQWWQAAASTQIRLGLPWRMSETFTLEPSVRLGGWSRAISGVSIGWQPTERLHVVVRTEQFENLLAPENSSGQSLMFGAMLRL